MFWFTKTEGTQKEIEWIEKKLGRGIQEGKVNNSRKNNAIDPKAENVDMNYTQGGEKRVGE